MAAGKKMPMHPVREEGESAKNPWGDRPRGDGVPSSPMGKGASPKTHVQEIPSTQRTDGPDKPRPVLFSPSAGRIHPGVLGAPLASVLEDVGDVRSVGCKVLATIGPPNDTYEALVAMLEVGASIFRVDLSSGCSVDALARSLDTLRRASQDTRLLCGVAIDTVGREVRSTPLQDAVELAGGETVVVSFWERDDGGDGPPDSTKEELRVEYQGLCKAVRVGSEVNLGSYLHTGMETTSCRLTIVDVDKANGTVVGEVQSGVVWAKGERITLQFVNQPPRDLPILADSDQANLLELAELGHVPDFLFLSYCHSAEDVRTAKAFLDAAELGSRTRVIAKIENAEGAKHYEAILAEADGIVLGRGSLGVDMAPEDMTPFQRTAIWLANVSNKPCLVSRVVDSLATAPRCTRAEGTDIANSVLDGADGMLLGIETQRGPYFREAIVVVREICQVAEAVFDCDQHRERLSLHDDEFAGALSTGRLPPGYAGELGKHELVVKDCMAFTAVRTAKKLRARLIVCYTHCGTSAAMVAKWRPACPVLAMVIPTLKSRGMEWDVRGEAEVRHILLHRGILPCVADADMEAAVTGESDAIIFASLDIARRLRLVDPGDEIVVMHPEGGEGGEVVKTLRVPPLDILARTRCDDTIGFGAIGGGDTSSSKAWLMPSFSVADLGGAPVSDAAPPPATTGLHKTVRFDTRP